MRHKIFFSSLVRVTAGAILVLAASSNVPAAEINVARTNWTERWITNLIDVRIPTNVFVNEYHTNFVAVVKTNTMEVKEVRTNLVTTYVTNWYHVSMTNPVAVNAWQTNFVTRYQTNAKVLNLTNWETVLAFKTNWITHPLTNLVQIDLTTDRFLATEVGATKPGSEPKPASVPVSVSLPPGRSANELIIEAQTTGRLVSNQPEVQLQVHWAGDPSTPVQVRQWRVEREDGVALCFGPEPVFKRALAVGKYRIEVKARRESNGQLFTARGTLDLKPREAVIQPLVAKR
jgi:hypothetical protein